MRIWYIALFIFIFNLALATVAELDVFGAYKPTTDTQLAERVRGQAEELAGREIGGIDYVRLIVDGANTLKDVLWQSTVGFYPMLLDLGLPSTVASLVATPVYLVFIAGVLQLVIGRYMER